MKPANLKNLEQINDEKDIIRFKAARLGIHEELPRWYLIARHVAGALTSLFIIIFGILLYRATRSFDGLQTVGGFINFVGLICLAPLWFIARYISIKKFSERLPSHLRTKLDAVYKAQRRRIYDFAIYSIVGVAVCITLLLLGIKIFN